MPYIQLVGRIVRFEEVGIGRSKRLSAIFSDDSGMVELVWFKGIKWVSKSLKLNIKYIVLGKATLFNGRFNIAHPELEEYKPDVEKVNSSLQAAYNTTEKLKNNFLASKAIYKLQQTLILQIAKGIDETLPSHLIDRYKLMTLPEALKQIHFPDSSALLQKSK